MTWMVVETNMYKKALLLMTLLTPMVAWADGKPDTFAILKNAAFDSMQKSEDLTTGAVVYRIELCSVRDCERFEAASDKLAMLSDYAYLFAAYAGTYDADTAHGAKDAPNPTVAEAKEKGYAQAVLDSYRDQYHCPQGDGERVCVMHAVFKEAGIRRYSVRYPQNRGESYYPVDEDGKPLSPP